MKNWKIIIISVVLALVVYGIYSWISGQQTSISPIPEDGIKVIQIAPTDK